MFLSGDNRATVKCRSRIFHRLGKTRKSRFLSVRRRRCCPGCFLWQDHFQSRSRPNLETIVEIVITVLLLFKRKQTHFRGQLPSSIYFGFGQQFFCSFNVLNKRERGRPNDRWNTFSTRMNVLGWKDTQWYRVRMTRKVPRSEWNSVWNLPFEPMLLHSTMNKQRKEAESMNPSCLETYILSIVILQKNILNRSFDQTDDWTKSVVIFRISTKHFNR